MDARLRVADKVMKQMGRVRRPSGVFPALPTNGSMAQAYVTVTSTNKPAGVALTTSRKSNETPAARARWRGLQ